VRFWVVVGIKKEPLKPLDVLPPPPVPALTTRLTSAARLIAPLVALTVSGYFVAVVFAPIEILSVEDRVALSNDAGAKVPVAFAGNPVTARLTVPLKPFRGVMVAV
jgi:hypothetical protein